MFIAEALGTACGDDREEANSVYGDLFVQLKDFLHGEPQERSFNGVTWKEVREWEEKQGDKIIVGSGGATPQENGDVAATPSESDDMEMPWSEEPGEA